MVTKSRRGFSLIEMLIALVITATLLTASLQALDSTFKCYKVTTEGASTHVVARIVMARVMAMIRTGTEFGPYPTDPLDPEQNPLVSTFIEFVSAEDEELGWRQVTRLERREAGGEDEEEGEEGGGEEGDGEPATYELWLVLTEFTDSDITFTEERMLIRNIKEALFTLEYSAGPRLDRATIDLTIQPDDFDDNLITADIEAPTVRLVSSASPRQLN